MYKFVLFFMVAAIPALSIARSIDNRSVISYSFFATTNSTTDAECEAEFANVQPGDLLVGKFQQNYAFLMDLLNEGMQVSVCQVKTLGEGPAARRNFRYFYGDPGDYIF